MNTGYLNLALPWAAVVFNQIAPEDPSGKPVASQDYSANDRSSDRLAPRGLRCARRVATRHDFQSAACHFDPGVLTCNGQKANTCLTSQQVGALKSAFASPKDSRGHHVYAPFPYDTGVGAEAPNSIPGFLPSSSGFSPFPRNFSLEINVDEREAAVDDAMHKLTDTNLWTNLSTFSGHGGKLLLYHGDSDPWFSPWQPSITSRDSPGIMAAKSSAGMEPDSSSCPAWATAGRLGNARPL